ncbi:MAG: DUF2752 domain-containing protein [Planctomycetota bacterium]|nr:DUF2752 domain-containing protein [Planctomycetota bacterium]
MSSQPVPVTELEESARARAAARPAAGATTRRRLAGSIVALGSLMMLLVAALLEPSADGLGTHRQFHLPQCGWITLMDTPCPTCGWTTAVAHAADGDLLSSFLCQPMGCLLAVGTAMAGLVGAYVAVTGSAVASMLRRLWGPYTGWLLAAIVVLAWIYKILSHKGVL